MDAKTSPNTFGLPVLHFHPLNSDYLIWTGNEDCTGFGENCRVVAHYSLKNGRDWTSISEYVRNCAWARDAELHVDSQQIICESYKNKQGNQRSFGMDNPLELIGGTRFFEKRTKLFDHVVGFAKFSEYLIVAEVRKCCPRVIVLVFTPAHSTKHRNVLSTYKFPLMDDTSRLASSHPTCAPINM